MKIKGKYLYLLAFKNQRFFKIGISSNSFNRITHLNNQYKIDYTNSYIITANDGLIRGLEIELLYIYPKLDVNIFKDKEGNTEIRHIEYLNDALNYLKSKHLNLNIKIYNVTDLLIKKIIVIDTINHSDIFMEIDFIEALFIKLGLISIAGYVKDTGISDKTVRNRIKAEKLPTLILGKTIFIIKSFIKN